MLAHTKHFFLYMFSDTTLLPENETIIGKFCYSTLQLVDELIINQSRTITVLQVKDVDSCVTLLLFVVLAHLICHTRNNMGTSDLPSFPNNSRRMDTIQK